MSPPLHSLLLALCIILSTDFTQEPLHRRTDHIQSKESEHDSDQSDSEPESTDSETTSEQDLSDEPEPELEPTSSDREFVVSDESIVSGISYMSATNHDQDDSHLGHCRQEYPVSLPW